MGYYQDKRELRDNLRLKEPHGGDKMSSSNVVYTEIESPIGFLTIVATEKGVCWLEFGKADDTLFIFKNWAKRWIKLDHLERNDQYLNHVTEQLNEYFSGNRTVFEIDVDLYGTHFQKLVWEQLLEIPHGQVRSYKDIAISIKSPKSVRAIGGANHNNPVPIIVPCHRVIGSNGNLIGYGGGIEIKKQLLMLEGYTNI